MDMQIRIKTGSFEQSVQNVLSASDMTEPPIIKLESS